MMCLRKRLLLPMVPEITLPGCIDIFNINHLKPNWPNFWVYGLRNPAAISAKLEHPSTEVVCLAGDGCAQMSIQEFGTAMQYNANIIIIISNNGVYGTIRMHQERTYPGRISGTDMLNPNFASLAQAYGGFGICNKN